MYLTKRQKEIADFIGRFIADRGYAPTLAEIGEAMQLSSVATVHKHLVNLEQKGVLKRYWNQGRAMELQPGMRRTAAVEIPLLGRVAAGRPIEAVEQAEVLTVPESMVGRNETYVLQVAGDSMTGEGILEGDYIIVESRAEAVDGEIVVALIGDDATVKRLYREGPVVRLQPSNPTMQPIRVPAEQVRVRGVVIGLIRKF